MWVLHQISIDVLAYLQGGNLGNPLPSRTSYDRLVIQKASHYEVQGIHDLRIVLEVVLLFTVMLHISKRKNFPIFTPVQESQHYLQSIMLRGSGLSCEFPRQ